MCHSCHACQPKNRERLWWYLWKLVRQVINISFCFIISLKILVQFFPKYVIDLRFGQNLWEFAEKTCSLVVTRVSVASQFVGSTSCGSEILGFNSVVFLVAGDALVDSETAVVTSSILRICRLSLRRCS
jgi:hypothetical protein